MLISQRESSEAATGDRSLCSSELICPEAFDRRHDWNHAGLADTATNIDLNDADALGVSMTWQDRLTLERSGEVREPDPESIAKAAAGDTAAFATLISLFQDPIWRFLTHLLGDEHLAEDATQETFFRVHRALDRFEGRSLFSTWVFGIARNTGLDMIRWRQRRPTVVGTILGDPAGPSVPGLSTEISVALASLPVAQREAVLIIEVLGFTYREAAEITGVAEGTFKSRVHHARCHLHEWMQAEGQANEL